MSLPAEILYATASYQARLRVVPPGAFFVPEKLPLETASHDAKTLARVDHYQCFLAEGSLASTSETLSEADASYGPGSHFDGSSPLAKTLKNVSSNPAVCLEILQGRDFPGVSVLDVTEVRPWGSFTVLRDEPYYKLKQLTVNPGNRLSLQRHQKREEHWIITAGSPEVTLDDSCIRLQAGDYICIPLHSWHRIANPGDASSLSDTLLVELIELQLGSYFGEDDIERKEDDYGRQ